MKTPGLQPGVFSFMVCCKNDGLCDGSVNGNYAAKVTKTSVLVDGKNGGEREFAAVGTND